jgi:diguanylate cyclase (GGDEF)-like protein
MAVIMFDIDKFKSVNDGYGHATGDRAIIAVADVCKKVLREIDLFGRQGGDEFLVVAPEIDLPSALVVAERLREAISTTSVMCDDGTAVTITSSFGLTISDSKSTLDELLSQADAALYEAKGHGRNCVWHDQKFE